MKITVFENSRGLLFVKGVFKKVLKPGVYSTNKQKDIEIIKLEDEIRSGCCNIETLLLNKTFKDCTIMIEVADQQLGLHFVNGQFKEALKPGRHVFWNVTDRHEFQLVNTSSPEVQATCPSYVFAKMPAFLYQKIEVAEYQKGLLFFNKRFVRVLEPGTYYFWKNDITVESMLVDTRLTKLDIVGQEILTLDKVALRINFVCNYRITDCVKAMLEIDDYIEHMHVAAQLALREYVGKYKLDEILENKDEMSKFVAERLKAKEAELFVEILDASVKDIILPGEIRDIMNTVLVAEKRAQANVITRREEVASTRSLLNTAKLMDENQTLYKLKELEYVERICENVGNITLNGSGDMLEQLTTILKGK